MTSYAEIDRLVRERDEALSALRYIADFGYRLDAKGT
jgi:hypothetical protein